VVLFGFTVYFYIEIHLVFETRFVSEFAIPFGRGCVFAHFLVVGNDSGRVYFPDHITTDGDRRMRVRTLLSRAAVYFIILNVCPVGPVRLRPSCQLHVHIVSITCFYSQCLFVVRLPVYSASG